MSRFPRRPTRSLDAVSHLNVRLRAEVILTDPRHLVAVHLHGDHLDLEDGLEHVERIGGRGIEAVLLLGADGIEHADLTGAIVRHEATHSSFFPRSTIRRAWLRVQDELSDSEHLMSASPLMQGRSLTGL